MICQELYFYVSDLSTVFLTFNSHPSTGMLNNETGSEIPTYLQTKNQYLILIMKIHLIIIITIFVQNIILLKKVLVTII